MKIPVIVRFGASNGVAYNISGPQQQVEKIIDYIAATTPNTSAGNTHNNG